MARLDGGSPNTGELGSGEDASFRDHDGGWGRRDGACAAGTPGAGFSFANAVVTPVENPGQILAWDFDGDGRDDLAFIGGAQSDQLWILLSAGGGRFGVPSQYAVTPRGDAHGFPAPLTLADVNRDGHLDLVTAEQLGMAANYTGRVSVLLGRSDGTFGKPIESGPIPFGFFGAPEIINIAVGDLNGDRVPDLFAAGQASAEMFGVGDGTFWLAPDFPLSRLAAKDKNLLQVALADLDRNGTADAVACSAGDGSYWPEAASGVGDGSFLPFQNQMALGYSCGFRGIAMIDLNKDGRLDMVTGNEPAVVAMGNGDGTFQKQFWACPPGGDVPGMGFSPEGLALADFDGDGNLDIPGGAYINKQSGMAVCRGNGDGTFRLPEMMAPIPNISSWTVTGDFDGDCRPDVLIASLPNGPLYVFLNTTP